MKLSEQEKAARKAAFRAMRPAEKLDYILTYYKWPILLVLIALFLLGSALHRELTKKEAVLYLGLVNVSAGEDLEYGLNEGFLRAAGLDPEKREIYLYRDLYLSDDADYMNHEYAYASRMKVMGALQAQKLDLAVMNREAYDLFSRQGYLMDLTVLTGNNPELDRRVAPRLTENQVILEDNIIEWELGEADTHELVTETVLNAIELSELPLFEKAGFTEPLYLGIIGNSQRTEETVRYLAYLLEGDGDA